LSKKDKDKILTYIIVAAAIFLILISFPRQANVTGGIQYVGGTDDTPWNGPDPWQVGIISSEYMKFGDIEVTTGIRKYNEYCEVNAVIKDKGEIIYQEDWWRIQPAFNDNDETGAKRFMYDGFDIGLGMNPKLQGRTSGQCVQFQNQLFLSLPTDTLEYEYLSFNQLVEQDEQTTIQLKVINNYRPMKIKLTMNMRIPLKGFDGIETDFTDQEIKDLDLPIGSSTYTFTIPTKQVGANIFIQPVAEIILEKDDVFGFNTGSCNDGRTINVKNCPDDTLVIHTITGEEKVLLVVPKPTYLEKPEEGCEAYNGYVASPFDSTICIRDDILDLSCVQLGCPTLTLGNEIIDYMCMSDGQCAQFITKLGCEEDSECEYLEAVCREGDDGKNYCVKTEFEEVIIGTDESFVRQSCAAGVEDYCADEYECVDEIIDEETVGFCKRAGLIGTITSESDNTQLFIIIGSVFLGLLLIQGLIKRF